MGPPKYSRAPPDSKEVESGRYYTVYSAPDGQTYVFWKGTKTTSLHEWEEDLDAMLLKERIQSWDDEIEHVMLWYGMESDTVHHDGFSRGGGIAKHFGGIGFGSAEFAKYPPAPGAQERAADDFFHKELVPVANTVSRIIPDTHPGDHPHAMDADDGAFDTPVKPTVDTKGPLQGTVNRDYSGFACAFVGFPAKIKYSRKRSITHAALGIHHAHPKHRSRVKRKVSFVEDSAKRPRVNDTPFEM